VKKFNAVIEDTELSKQEDQFLLGTTSVEISELCRMLKMRALHNVLNAKCTNKKAKIVEEAGKPGGNYCNNMAGRGTDIKLSAEVKAAGGLAL
jgi:preprotein translocase subunit SecA